MVGQLQQTGAWSHRWIWRRAPLILLVPVGVWVGWSWLQTPSHELLSDAALGRREALEELILRAQEDEGAEARNSLNHLLAHDENVAFELACMAPASEQVMDYLIASARSQAPWVASLASLEISHHVAESILRKINPSGIDKIRELAKTLANASFLLGVAYELGWHVEQNWEASAIWYQRAHKMGYEMARGYYAQACYEVALGSAEDAVAVAWYHEAALNNHPFAQCKYGMCLSNGRGVKQNFEEAAVWFRKSAEQGCWQAQFNMGYVYWHGEGVEVDYEKALYWFREAAGQGDATSQYYVGLAYERGCGVPSDILEAIKWYKQAAEQNEPAAQCALGHICSSGTGVAQNWSEAVRWYQLAAAQGHSDALLCLADCYEWGLGVEKNQAKAHHYRTLSVAEDSQDIENEQ